jgi:hypothetical protein
MENDSKLDQAKRLKRKDKEKSCSRSANQRWGIERRTKRRETRENSNQQEKSAALHFYTWLFGARPHRK